MNYIELKMPDREYALMLKTIKLLNLNKALTQLVIAMCNALFASGADEASKIILKNLEKKLEEAEKN